jgi:hypothetical protein
VQSGLAQAPSGNLRISIALLQRTEKEEKRGFCEGTPLALPAHGLRPRDL